MSGTEQDDELVMAAIADIQASAGAAAPAAGDAVSP